MATHAITASQHTDSTHAGAPRARDPDPVAWQAALRRRMQATGSPVPLPSRHRPSVRDQPHRVRPSSMAADIAEHGYGNRPTPGNGIEDGAARPSFAGSERSRAVRYGDRDGADGGRAEHILTAALLLRRQPRAPHRRHRGATNSGVQWVGSKQAAPDRYVDRLPFEHAALAHSFAATGVPRARPQRQATRVARAHGPAGFAILEHRAWLAFRAMTGNRASKAGAQGGRGNRKHASAAAKQAAYRARKAAAAQAAKASSGATIRAHKATGRGPIEVVE